MLFILAKHFKPIDTDSFLFNSPDHNPYQKTGLVDQKDMFYGYVSPEKNIFCSGADGIIKDKFGVSFIKNWKYESKKITFTREFEGGIQGADYTLELHKNYLWFGGWKGTRLESGIIIFSVLTTADQELLKNDSLVRFLKVTR